MLSGSLGILSNMFAVPFEHYPRVRDHEKYKSKLLQIFDDDDNSSHRLTKSGEVIYDLKTDFFHNDKEQLLPSYYGLVTQALGSYLREIESNIGFELEIESMWYQSSSRGQYHQVHNHGAVGMSFVWYVEFNPKVHKATTFFCPFSDPLTGDLIQNTPEVEEGDLVVFPSFLLHEQEMNDSDERRTIVSFNINGVPKKKYRRA